MIKQWLFSQSITLKNYCHLRHLPIKLISLLWPLNREHANTATSWSIMELLKITRTRMISCKYCTIHLEIFCNFSLKHESMCTRRTLHLHPCTPSSMCSAALKQTHLVSSTSCLLPAHPSVYTFSSPCLSGHCVSVLSVLRAKEQHTTQH